jgi:hypothetical protein
VGQRAAGKGVQNSAPAASELPHDSSGIVWVRASSKQSNSAAAGIRCARLTASKGALQQQVVVVCTLAAASRLFQQQQAVCVCEGLKGPGCECAVWSPSCIAGACVLGSMVGSLCATFLRSLAVCSSSLAGRVQHWAWQQLHQAVTDFAAGVACSDASLLLSVVRLITLVAAHRCWLLATTVRLLIVRLLAACFGGLWHNGVGGVGAGLTSSGNGQVAYGYAAVYGAASPPFLALVYL